MCVCKSNAARRHNTNIQFQRNEKMKLLFGTLLIIIGFANTLQKTMETEDISFQQDNRSPSKVQ